MFEEALIKEAASLNRTEIETEIIKVSHVAWDAPLSHTNITTWLNNFNGSALGSADAERNLAIRLLASITYYNQDDVRCFCQYIFSEYIHRKLIEYQITGVFQDKDIEDRIDHILDSTMFLALGNSSESGSNILYYFRQANHLTKNLFEREPRAGIDNLVFVDDVTISGVQAMTYIPRMTQVFSAKHIYFLTFLATDTAISDLKPLNVETIYGNLLTNRERCFEPESYVFSGKKIEKFRLVTAAMCDFYGSIITKGHPEVDSFPFGHDQSQSMLCFFYNTPDNTLPIFWCDGHGWKPIFKRYLKEPKTSEVALSDSEYV